MVFMIHDIMVLMSIYHLNPEITLYILLMDIMIPNGSQVVTQLYKMFIKIRMV